MKAKTKTYYKKKLDAVFSKYIRQKHSVDGIVSCYTCPKSATISEMQNGHFVPRQYLSLRWDERNCRPQCYACNMLYNGQPSAFAARLEAESPGIVKELEGKRKEIRQWTIPELEEMVQMYQSKLKTP